MRHRRRAFFVADAILGLAIIATLSMILATSLTRTHAASRRLAESRAAVRASEQVLLALQGNGELPRKDEHVKFEVRKIEGGDAVADRVWVEVRATFGARSAVLVGLADPDSLQRLGGRK